MTDAPTSTLDRLLAECITALEEQDQSAVERLIDANPEHAAALRERLEQLNSLGILAAPKPAARIPERLGDFRLLRPIGRGGMGIVYLAEQDALQRQVALKLVHPEQLLFAGARERFRREVLAIARLQHHGIVPILTGGEADGIPFYAMELVHGASLGELLQELEGTAPAALDGAALASALARAMAKKHDMTAVAEAELFHGAWPRVCCRLVAMACEALQHAHNNGVLHRDLKPSNLLLTADGEVRLIDFGLASASGERRITRSGATIGSLPYMAPEQIRGNPDRLDERTDIYQLGVTFYELLALRLPHGDGTGNTRERILAGMSAPPSRHTPQVHPDVDAICLQAMDLNPARRYQTARELQQDLQAFLEQRTVQARRPSAALRLLRWIRRHPLAAGCAIAATALFVIAPLGIAIQQHLANQRIQAALTTATEQRAIAEQNFGEALNAIHQMLLRTAEARLAEVPRTAPLRRQLVEDAIAIHSRLVTSDHESSGRVDRIQARTHGQLGELHLELGALAEAEASLRAAVTAFEAVLAGDDATDEDRHRFAQLHLSLASVHTSRGEHPAMLRAYEAAAAAYAAIPATAAVRNLQKHRLAVDLAYSQALAQAGDVEAARQRWLALDGKLEDALEDAPTGSGVDGSRRIDAHDRIELWAEVARSRGILAAQAGDPASALQHFREAMRRIDTGDGIEASDRLAWLAASVAESIGLVLHQQRNWEQAAPWLDRGHRYFEVLVERDPEIPRNHMRLARLLTARAENRMRRGVAGDAEADFERAIAVLTAIVAKAPDDVQARRSLAMAHAERATFQLALDDTIAATLSFAEAERQFESLLGELPTNRMLRGNFAAMLANAAVAIAAEGDTELAADKLARAIEVQDSLQGTEPERQSIEMRLHGSRVAVQAGNFEAAERMMAEARSRGARYLEAGPREPIRVQTATYVGIEDGELQFVHGRNREAIEAWTATVPTARLAGEQSRYGKRLLQRLLLRLADAHLRVDEPGPARSWFRDAVANGASKAVVGNARRLRDLFDRPDLQPPSNGK